MLFVPARESCEEEEGDEGQDYCYDATNGCQYFIVVSAVVSNLQQVWENDLVLECLRDPDQVQRVLVYADLLSQRRCVVGA